MFFGSVAGDRQGGGADIFKTARVSQSVAVNKIGQVFCKTEIASLSFLQKRLDLLLLFWLFFLLQSIADSFNQPAGVVF